MNIKKKQKTRVCLRTETVLKERRGPTQEFRDVHKSLGGSLVGEPRRCAYDAAACVCGDDASTRTRSKAEPIAEFRAAADNNGGGLAPTVAASRETMEIEEETLQTVAGAQMVVPQTLTPPLFSAQHWLRTFLRRTTVYGLRHLLVRLLQLQRHAFLCSYLDPTQRVTHVLSRGRLKAERHSVCTADGYQIFFYRLRRVDRHCCCCGCGGHSGVFGINSRKIICSNKICHKEAPRREHASVLCSSCNSNCACERGEQASDDECSAEISTGNSHTCRGYSGGHVFLERAGGNNEEEASNLCCSLCAEAAKPIITAAAAATSANAGNDTTENWYSSRCCTGTEATCAADTTCCSRHRSRSCQRNACCCCSSILRGEADASVEEPRTPTEGCTSTVNQLTVWKSGRAFHHPPASPGDTAARSTCSSNSSSRKNSLSDSSPSSCNSFEGVESSSQQRHTAADCWSSLPEALNDQRGKEVTDAVAAEPLPLDEETQRQQHYLHKDESLPSYPDGKREAEDGYDCDSKRRYATAMGSNVQTHQAGALQQEQQHHQQREETSTCGVVARKVEGKNNETASNGEGKSAAGTAPCFISAATAVHYRLGSLVTNAEEASPTGGDVVNTKRAVRRRRTAPRPLAVEGSPLTKTAEFVTTAADTATPLHDKYASKEAPGWWREKVRNAELFSSKIENSERGPAVFMQHGLLESSLNWVSGGSGSLAFMLANEGCDVWLGNNRGNEYTRVLPDDAKRRLQQQQQLKNYRLYFDKKCQSCSCTQCTACCRSPSVPAIVHKGEKTTTFGVRSNTMTVASPPDGRTAAGGNVAASAAAGGCSTVPPTAADGGCTESAHVDIAPKFCGNNEKCHGTARVAGQDEAPNIQADGEEPAVARVGENQSSSHINVRCRCGLKNRCSHSIFQGLSGSDMEACVREEIASLVRNQRQTAQFEHWRQVEATAHCENDGALRQQQRCVNSQQRDAPQQQEQQRRSHRCGPSEGPEETGDFRDIATESPLAATPADDSNEAEESGMPSSPASAVRRRDTQERSCSDRKTDSCCCSALCCHCTGLTACPEFTEGISIQAQRQRLRKTCLDACAVLLSLLGRRRCKGFLGKPHAQAGVQSSEKEQLFRVQRQQQQRKEKCGCSRQVGASEKNEKQHQEQKSKQTHLSHRSHLSSEWKRQQQSLHQQQPLHQEQETLESLSDEYERELLEMMHYSSLGCGTTAAPPPPEQKKRGLQIGSCDSDCLPVGSMAGGRVTEPHVEEMHLDKELSGMQVGDVSRTETLTAAHSTSCEGVASQRKQPSERLRMQHLEQKGCHREYHYLSEPRGWQHDIKGEGHVNAYGRKSLKKDSRFALSEEENEEEERNNEEFSTTFAKHESFIHWEDDEVPPFPSALKSSTHQSWTYRDMAAYDVPAMLDYILTVRRRELTSTAAGCKFAPRNRGDAAVCGGNFKKTDPACAKVSSVNAFADNAVLSVPSTLRLSTRVLPKAASVCRVGPNSAPHSAAQHHVSGREASGVGPASPVVDVNEPDRHLCICVNDKQYSQQQQQSSLRPQHCGIIRDAASLPLLDKRGARSLHQKGRTDADGWNDGEEDTCEAESTKNSSGRPESANYSHILHETSESHSSSLNAEKEGDVSYYSDDAIWAVGQSQGAAQLLAMLALYPALGLLFRGVVLFSPPVVLQSPTTLTHSARFLINLALQMPERVLLGIRTAEQLLPVPLLSVLGDFVAGKRLMGFYTGCISWQQRCINFRYTPSGGTSKRNFELWVGSMCAAMNSSGDRTKDDTLSSRSTSTSAEDTKTRQAAVSFRQDEGKDVAANAPSLQGGASPATPAIEGDIESKTTREEKETKQGRREPHREKLEEGRGVIEIGTGSAASFPLEKICCPLFAMLGRKDNLVDADATFLHLSRCLEEKKLLHMEVWEESGHLDFGWAQTRCADLYPRLIRLILSRKYSQELRNYCLHLLQQQQ